MQCKNKQCLKPILNKRNAVKGNGELYCSYDCFLERDLALERVEEKAMFIRSKIGMFRSMKYAMYYIHRPAKSAELDKRIAAYRQDLELIYNELKGI